MSDINFTTINENFPVAGQDNDTQVFRDNFDSIKRNFRIAQEEITNLENTVIRSDSDNDLKGQTISGAVFKNNSGAVFAIRDRLSNELALQVANTSIDSGNGEYQIYKLGNSISFTINNFPITQKVSKVVLELSSDTGTHDVTFLTTGTEVYKKRNWPSTNSTLTITTESTIVEIWKYESGTTFLNYVGEFVQ